MIRIRTPAGEETLDLAEFEARVTRGEIPPDTPVSFPLVSGEAFVPARELEIFRGLYSPSRIYFRRYFNLATFPILTLILLLANVVVFALGQVLFGAGAGQTADLVRMGAKAGPLITDLGESWRLLTANFVHRDWLHLTFNLFVLFNVGGALENAYRWFDYVLILLVSALGTTLLSFLGSSAISAGASGMVFGCFGGVVVFGLKYRDIIPRRYRRFFGTSVVPYVLVFLWLGWMSTGIDNWGHLGGLIGGTLTTLALRPKLLDAGADLARRRRRHLGLAGALVATVLLAGPLWSRLGLSTVVERDDDSGLEVAHPASWRRAITQLGQLGFSNGLPEPTYVQALAEIRSPPIALDALADEWFALQLESKEHGGAIRGVRREPPRSVRVAGEPGLAYRAAFEALEAGGQVTDYRLDLYVFARGQIAAAVVFLAPERRFPRYAPLFQRMLASVRLTEPRFLRQARAAVLLDGDDPEAGLRLGEAWQRLGEIQRAAQTYRGVLARVPGSRPARLALARLLVGWPARRAEGEALLDRLLEESRDPDERVDLLLLAARYDLEAGRREQAWSRLEMLEELVPEDPRVEALARTLTPSP